MTQKKKLNWKLKQLPTASEVADLVAQKIISPEEARDILFNNVDKSEQISELHRQIEFLEKVIDSLYKKNYTQVTYIPTYPRWTYVSNIGAGWMNTVATTGMGNTNISYSVDTAKLLK